MAKADEAIKKDVMDQLFWDDRVDASNLKIDVAGGVVTLSGKVPNYNALRSAIEDTDSIREVQSVVNKVSVEYPETHELPSDHDLQDNLQRMLMLISSIDSTNVRVSVDRNVATIDGTVDSYWKKLKVAELALDVTGIKSVINRLSVVPTKDYLDKEIAEDIVKAFDRNIFIDVNEVDVEVGDGIVTLSGKVQDRAAMNTALNIVKHTSGVVDVVNNLATS